MDDYALYLRRREEKNGSLRLQQVHVSLWRRLCLYAQVRLLRIQLRYKAWRDLTPGDGYVDGYVHGFNLISGLYDELVEKALYCVNKPGDASGLEDLEEVIKAHGRVRMGPPATELHGPWTAKDVRPL